MVYLGVYRLLSFVWYSVCSQSCVCTYAGVCVFMVMCMSCTYHIAGFPRVYKLLCVKIIATLIIAFGCS